MDLNQSSSHTGRWKQNLLCFVFERHDLLELLKRVHSHERGSDVASELDVLYAFCCIGDHHVGSLRSGNIVEDKVNFPLIEKKNSNYSGISELIILDTENNCGS